MDNNEEKRDIAKDNELIKSILSKMEKYYTAEELDCYCHYILGPMMRSGMYPNFVCNYSHSIIEMRNKKEKMEN